MKKHFLICLLFSFVLLLLSLKDSVQQKFYIPPVNVMNSSKSYFYFASNELSVVSLLGAAQLYTRLYRMDLA